MLYLVAILVSADIAIRPDGSIRIGNGELLVRHYHPQWRTSVPRHNQTVIPSSGGLFKSPWKLFDGTEAEWVENIRKDQNGIYRIQYLFRSERPARTAILTAELTLPVKEFQNTVLTADGKDILLNAGKNGVVFPLKKVREVHFSLFDGTLRISFPESAFLEILDQRHWNKNFFCLRIRFSPDAGNLTESRLSMNLQFSPFRGIPVDLSPIVNRTFHDPVPNDGKGGWTDQGPSNDMRNLPMGTRKVGTLNFPVLPAGCAVVGGKARKGYPAELELSVKDSESHSWLALLHAGAWLPAPGQKMGDISVRYLDGTSQKIPIISGKDIGNWWKPAALPNGIVAWEGSNSSASVGLYCSFFPLKGKPVASLKFETAGDTPLWMIVSALFTNGRMNVPRQEPVTILRNAEWRPFLFDRSVQKGSALDFSFLLDAPAGKYGYLQVTPDGHFQFEKQKKPVRFYGTNISFWALYMNKQDCNMIAERLARCGYNAVRLHHFDRDLVDRSNRKDSHRILPERLDQLDYLIAALKRNGIYLTTDLYTARYPAPEEFPGLPDMKPGYEYKAMVMISDEVRSRFKNWVRQLFTHRNPYTGLTWAEDPAFIGISILNENSIFFILQQRCRREIREFYQKEFRKRCRERGIAVTTQNHDVLFNRFCREIYQEYYQEMVKFLREIGVRAPLTDQNFIESPNYHPFRMEYDYVDNHLYWDHPVSLGNGLTPVQFCNYSVLRNNLFSPRLIMPTRIFGKPFTVTEFDFCYPNRFRAEGAPLFSAYAALQDWDAVYRFGYSGGKDRALTEVSIEAFDCANDVIRMLSERIGAAFFLRRDVRPARIAFAAAVPEDVTSQIWPDYPLDLQMLGLYGKVGSVSCREGKCSPSLPSDCRAVFSLTPDAFPRGVKCPVFTGFYNLSGKIAKANLSTGRKNERIQSSTAELTADFKKQTFSAVTPYSEALILPEGERLAGKTLSARTAKGFAVISLIAVDGKPLRESQRLLLLHLTDVQLEGITFSGSDQRIVTRWPKGQLLAGKGVAEISLSLPDVPWKLYALTPSGKRIAELPITKDGNGSLKWTADTFRDPHEIVFAYELQRGK